MAKRHNNCSCYCHRRKTTRFVKLKKMLNKYRYLIYNKINTRYFVLITLSVVLFFVLLLPDLNDRIDGSELQEMKKVLDKITEDIASAERACNAAAEEIHILQYNLNSIILGV